MHKLLKLVCTPHILTETSKCLLRQSGDPVRSEIMTTFKRFIDLADERRVQSAQAAELPSFVRLGLTDAAILSLDLFSAAAGADGGRRMDHRICRKGFHAQNLTAFLFE